MQAAKFIATVIKADDPTLNCAEPDGVPVSPVKTTELIVTVSPFDILPVAIEIVPLPFCGPAFIVTASEIAPMATLEMLCNVSESVCN